MSASKKKSIVQGALVRDSLCLLDTSARWQCELRLHRELVEAQEVSRRVWEKNGLQGLHRDYLAILSSELNESNKQRHLELFTRLTERFETGIPLEILKAMELERLLGTFRISGAGSSAHEYPLYSAIQLEDSLYSAIQLGRCREALEIHLRDGALLDQRRNQIEALNSGRRVTDEERARVMSLNETLKSRHAKPSPRYREIAKRLKDPKITLARVRYIIEGPRRAKN